MLTTAMKHQTACVEKLDRLRVGALFMEMGTGKGRTFMEIGERKLDAEKASRVCILCPVSGKDHLVDDVIKHTGHVPSVHGENYTQSIARYNIIGIESQSTSVRALNRLAALAEDAVVIIDESQLIKNRDAARTKHIIDATRKSRYRYISSGLPMPNGVEDLWSQMSFLSGGILDYRTYAEFSRYHLKHSGDCVEKYGQGRVIGRFNTDVIAAKIAPYAFEARKIDCLDLPPKSYSYRVAKFSEEAAAAYDEAKARILHGDNAFSITDTTIYRLFTALQMISAGLVPTWLFEEGEYPNLRNGKIDLLLDLLRETTGKTVVWCKYLHEANAVAEALENANISFSRIDGTVPKLERRAQINAFKTDTNVLISTIQVGGMVHDWGFADYAVYMSNSFDYMLRAQSEDRIHRAMMTGKAHYIDLRVDTGIERRIVRSLDKKENALRAFQDKIRQLRRLGSKEAEKSIVEEVSAL